MHGETGADVDSLSSISLVFLYLYTMIVSPSHTAGVHSGAVGWPKQLNTLNGQAPHAREEYRICENADFICITPMQWVHCTDGQM